MDNFFHFQTRGEKTKLKHSHNPSTKLEFFSLPKSEATRETGLHKQQTYAIGYSYAITGME